MSDLKLLSPDQPTPLERLLMDAASRETPSSEQRMRVRQALGLPALVAAPPMPRVTRSAMWLKGVVAGAVVVSALVFQFRPRATSSLPPQPVTVHLLSAQAPAALPRPEAAPAPVAQPLPPLEAASSTAPSTHRHPRSAARDAPPSPSTDLSEQLRLIEAARVAVAARDASAASHALSSYSSQFPRGAFSQEAQVLRIETMDLQGRHAQAAAMARSFLARHPNSPHVGLVQRIAGTP